MANKRMKSDTAGNQAAVIERVRRLLASIPAGTPAKRDEIRSEVRRLIEITGDLRRLAKLRLSALTPMTSATDRILAYLKLFVGEVLDGKELAVVSGIQEYARRVRELRVQFGYKISTGTTCDDLRPDQYRLDAADPDADAAEKWKLMNEIRRKKGLSGMDRALELLKAYVGKPVTGDAIKYVAKIRSAERRVRQLRTEFGWRIVTRHTGRPELPNDAYVLETMQQLPEHDRHIPDNVYDKVLERDKYKCRRCDWSLETRNPAERRQFLEVHHIAYHHKGGTNDPDNLVTLCNVDHDEVHRKDISEKDLTAWIKQGRKPA
ncbi:MAG: HNH endonuclease signature motif containing protein [Elusimicrobiota bacterium]|jgi:hypothetical protein